MSLSRVDRASALARHATSEQAITPRRRAQRGSARRGRRDRGGPGRVDQVLISRILNAVKCDDPLEALQRLPGPESLRGFVTGMGRIGVPATRVKAALRVIDRFDALIRDRYGTPGKLNAAICSHAPSMQRRLELERIARAAGQDLDAMRVHRLSVAYPPFGFEFVSTFRLRAAAR